MEFPSPSSDSSELSFADSTEQRPPREFVRKPRVGVPLVVVKKTPYSRPQQAPRDDKRKRIEVALAPRASNNLLRQCFGKPDAMCDIVSRERMVFRMSETFRLNIAKEWLENLKKDPDYRSLQGDAAMGRRTQRTFQELFAPEAAKGPPPTELFISCGVAPDLLQGQLMAEVINETKKEGKFTHEHRRVAVPCMWMRLELEELCMFKRVREDIHAAFYKQVTDFKLSENEVWHCAVEQVNAARVLVANQCAYYERSKS